MLRPQEAAFPVSVRREAVPVLEVSLFRDNGLRGLNQPFLASVRVDPGLTTRAPHRPVRADLPHTVLQLWVSLKLGSF